MIVRVVTPRFAMNVGDKILACGAVSVRYGWASPTSLRNAPYIPGDQGLRLSESSAPFGTFKLADR